MRIGSSSNTYRFQPVGEADISKAVIMAFEKFDKVSGKKWNLCGNE